MIAVGTAPFRPQHIPFNETSVFDSDNVASDPRVPKSLTVVGAGVIGLEYATIFSAMDVPVTLVEPREQFLEFIDREIIEEFVHELRKRGMQLRLGVKVDAVELDNAGLDGFDAERRTAHPHRDAALRGGPGRGDGGAGARDLRARGG